MFNLLKSPLLLILLSTITTTTVFGQEFNWNITRDDPYVDIGFNDAKANQELVFHYTIANQSVVFDIRDYNNCNISDTTGSLGAYIANETFTSPLKDLDIGVDIAQGNITSSPYYNATGSLNETGVIEFCLRLDLMLDDDSTSVNFHESKISIDIDMKKGFEVTGVTTDRDEATSTDKNATLDYSIQAYQCTNSSSGEELSTLVQGDFCTICVETNATNVYVSSILELDFTQQGNDDVTYPSIDGGVPSDLTSVNCDNDEEVCVAKTQMVSAFFADASPSPLNVSGTCVLAFGTSRRLSSVITNNNNNKKRNLQQAIAADDDDTDTTSPFDLQVVLESSLFNNNGAHDDDDDDDAIVEETMNNNKDNNKLTKQQQTSTFIVIVSLFSMGLVLLLGVLAYNYFVKGKDNNKSQKEEGNESNNDDDNNTSDTQSLYLL